jgi:thiamine-phosphate pyrophosphorylase
METTPLYRVLDASFNRASEGLRVIEDYVRFVLDDSNLTRLVKTQRHALAAAAGELPAEFRHAARDTLADVGTCITAAEERKRANVQEVAAASFQRVEQSLRSLEEYTKVNSPPLAARFETMRYSVYTLEKCVSICRQSCEQLANVRLMVLIDGCGTANAFEQLVCTLTEAGVGAIQLRDKSLEDGELLARARQLRTITRDTPTLCVVNDRPDIAVLACADALHLGEDDLSIKDARSIVGTRMLIGFSTHELEGARRSILAGASYLGAGPTFPSDTKSFSRLAGLEYLRALATETSLPTFAIGGIHAGNVRDVLATGIERVAVSAAVTKADDPAAAAKELISLLDAGMETGP